MGGFVCLAFLIKEYVLGFVFVTILGCGLPFVSTYIFIARWPERRLWDGHDIARQSMILTLLSTFINTRGVFGDCAARVIQAQLTVVAVYMLRFTDDTCATTCLIAPYGRKFLGWMFDHPETSFAGFDAALNNIYLSPIFIVANMLVPPITTAWLASAYFEKIDWGFRYVFAKDLVKWPPWLILLPPIWPIWIYIGGCCEANERGLAWVMDEGAPVIKRRSCKSLMDIGQDEMPTAAEMGHDSESDSEIPDFEEKEEQNLFGENCDMVRQLGEEGNPQML